MGVPENWYGPEGSLVEQVSDSTITEYMNKLVDFRTRYTCTDSNSAASHWIYDKFIEYGYTEVYLDSFPYEPYTPFPCDTQWNVIAVKQGSVTPDEVIIIGGHYDSTSEFDPECDPDTLAPGADDNASGTVVTLETARILSDVDTDVTLIFVPFAAEEQGKWGSEYYAEKAFNEGMDIRVMFNMDMVSYTEDEYWDVQITADNSSIHFAELVADMATQYTNLIPIISIGTSMFSDHHSFYLFGYNFVYTHESDFNWNYHTCDDIVENVNLEYLTEITEMIAASILYTANMPGTPEEFNVVNVGDGTSLYLDWEPNTESDIAGYNIYYGTSPGEYDSLKFVIADEDTLQNLLENKMFYLAVSALDIDGYESFLTNEIELISSSIPSAPTGLITTLLENEIILGWQNVGELDVGGYNVYRYPIGGPPEPILLGFVSEPNNSFTDNTAEIHTLYAYYVTAVDTQIPPNESEPSEEILARRATHDLGILIVDNTLDGSGGPFSPTDEEVDDYYADLFKTYNIGAMWDVRDSITANHLIMDYDVGLFSTVFWHKDIHHTLSTESDTITMRKYLQGGGNLWLSGWKLIQFLSGQSEPYHIFEEGEFVSTYMGIDSAKTSSGSEREFIEAHSLEGEFPDLSIDTEKVITDGLFYMDIMLPPFDGTYPIYSYVSLDSMNSEYHGYPISCMSNSTEYGFIVTDFPLYFMDQDDSQLLVDAVMEIFGEPVSIGDGEIARIPLTLSLYQNFPNPFNPTTTISFDIPGTEDVKQHVDLTIYNLRGRHVKTLISEKLDPGSHKVVWDGKNEQGQHVSSGIYLYTLKSGDKRYTRKMVVLE